MPMKLRAPHAASEAMSQSLIDAGELQQTSICFGMAWKFLQAVQNGQRQKEKMRPLHHKRRDGGCALLKTLHTPRKCAARTNNHRFFNTFPLPPECYFSIEGSEKFSWTF
jgi:hypothetical protein